MTQDIFDRITDGFTVFDKDLNYVFINRKAAEILERDTQELIGKNVFREFSHWVGTPLYYDYMRAMDEQIVITTEAYFPEYDKFFEGTLYPSPDGLSVYFQDVTERKRAQLALEESEARYRTIVETSQEGIWQLDANDVTTFVNGSMTSLLGYTKQEMIGKVLFDFMEQEAIAEAVDLMQKRKNGIAEKHEFTFRRKDGKPVHALMQSSPVFKDGKYNGAVATLLDITGRKAAEQKLVANERFFRALFENSLDGIALLSAKGTIIDVSPSIEGILGYTKEELVNTKTLNFVVGDREALTYATFKEVVAVPNTKTTIEYEVVTKNGEEKYIEATYKNLLHEPGVNAVVVNYRDVTEIKNTIRQLQNSEARYRSAQVRGKLGHWEMDIKSGKLYWSDEIYTLFNLKKEDCSPDYDTFLSYVSPDDRAFVEANVREAIQSNIKYDVVYRILLPNGILKYIHGVGEVVVPEEGEPEIMAGMVQDVTRQKEIEQQLISSEKNYRLLFEENIVPMWMAKPHDLNFIEVNKAAVAEYGYSKEEFLRMSPRDIRANPDSDYFLAIDAEFQQYGPFDYHVQHRKKDGGLIHMKLYANRINYAEQDVWLFAGVNVTGELRITEQLRELAARTENIREEERTEIAREIHDELGQQLTGLKLDMSWIKKQLTGKDEAVITKIEGSLQLINQTITTVRKISTQLRPSILDNLGLAEALDWQISDFSQRSGVRVSFFSNVHDVQYPPAISTAIFRTVQEALTNIARHANATLVFTELIAKDDILILMVEDNGTGFDLLDDPGKKTLGLLGMRERVELLGGTYNITSPKGKGTRICVEIPLQFTKK